jgi:hypothetical protein
MGLACLDLEFGLVGFAFALGHGGDPSSPGQGHMYNRRGKGNTREVWSRYGDTRSHSW